MPPRRFVRRDLLAATGVLVGTASAGCLDRSADGSADQDDENGSGPPMIANLERVQLTLGTDGVTPAAVRVNADVRITVAVENETDREHVVVQPDSEFQPLTVAGGTVDSQLWAVPAQPGTYHLRCRPHDRSLTRVDVEPGGVGGGCPSE